MFGQQRFSRRRVLALGTATAFGTVVLAACQSQPQTVTKVVTQVVEKQVTQVVEKQVTTVVQQQVTQVVEKQVTTIVQQQVVVTATPLAATTLEFWYSKPEFLRPLEDIMKLYKTSASNVTINVTTTANDVFQPKLEAALAAGTGPDMWATGARPGVDDAIKSGVLLELTHLIDTSQMFPLAVDNGTLAGKLWTVCVGGFNVGMGYDSDFFGKNNLKPPTTWEEWTALNDQLKKLGKIPIINAGKAANHTYWVQQGLWDSILGESGFDELIAGKRKMTDADMVSAVQLFVGWNDAGYLQKGMLGTEYEEAKAMFATNKGEISSSGPDDFKGYLQVNPNAKLSWFPFPPPASGGKAAAVSGNDPAWGANAKTKQPDASVKFLDWSVHPDGQQAFVDFYGGMPVIGAVQVDDPIRKIMVATPEHVTAWFHRQATNDATAPFTNNSPALFLHQMTPEAYCGEIQKVLDADIAKGVA